MGLFKKRATDPAEIERLKAEIASMGARLNASDVAKTELDDTVRGITNRLDASTPAPPSPPPSTPPPAPPTATPVVDTAELDKLNAKIERLTTRVDDAPAPTVDPATIDALSTRVEELTSRVDDAPTGGVDHAHIEQLSAEVQRIGQRIDDVDARITAISTELANQLTELSADIDAGGSSPGDAVVDEFRDAQTRLAGEQARYQIAFRRDLADLADRLKRS